MNVTIYQMKVSGRYHVAGGVIMQNALFHVFPTNVSPVSETPSYENRSSYSFLLLQLSVNVCAKTLFNL